MKYLLLISVLFVVGVAYPIAANAQFTPEFSMDLTMTSGNFHKTITIGYDSLASDGCEPALGEKADYPPPGFKEFVLVNTDTSFHDTRTPVDYRHKPTADSFQITYQWDVESDELPLSISWNPGQIPALVKHIYVVPSANPNQILTDLKTKSSIAVPIADSMLFYRHCFIILLYNLETFAVQSGSQATLLLDRITAFPNPTNGNLRLSMNLKHNAQLSISGYDASGRLVMSRRMSGRAGANTLPLSNATAKGPLFLRVQATDGSGVTNVMTTTAIRE